MSTNHTFCKLALLAALLFGLSSCYRPPHNNFEPYNPMPEYTARGAAVGLAAGVLTSQISNALIPGGAIAGGVAGAAISVYKNSKPGLVNTLKDMDIQYVEYGDTMTLVVPTDRYFVFNTPIINEICYPGLVAIVKLLKLYPHSTIYVAGFTDDIGSLEHKRNLSNAQAQAMLTYLWANGIAAKRLTAEGYGDKYAVSDNHLIHGSAQNRRLEIQWFNAIKPKKDILGMMGYTK